jgi:hypothetical protein
LWGVGTGDGVAGTVWTADHTCCFFLLWELVCRYGAIVAKFEG